MVNNRFGDITNKERRGQVVGDVPKHHEVIYLIAGEVVNRGGHHSVEVAAGELGVDIGWDEVVDACHCHVVAVCWEYGEESRYTC